ncbi:hypothetical protein AVEN_106448-1 [Araneus ventricosus]|uniref:Uncharacterized protein n=1 Tax=Araneus ventricosus TaxID=182803 RepID=A0A4Y2AT86_ARAVE|nr:hypothetical protein AVEN_106448-1 [Araneus ventricosus]
MLDTVGGAIKDARYFTHTCSSYGYSSNEILIRVKWSLVNKTLQMSPEPARTKAGLGAKLTCAGLQKISANKIIYYFLLLITFRNLVK